MANNSCSRIGYRVSAGCIFRDMKAIGQRCPLYFPCAHHNTTLAFYPYGNIIWPYIWDICGIGYIIFHFLVRNIGCGIDKAILDV